MARTRVVGGIAVVLLLVFNPFRVIEFLAFDPAFTRASSKLLIRSMWLSLFLLAIACIFLSRHIARVKHQLATLALSVVMTVVLLSVLMAMFYPFNWDSSWVEDRILHHKVIPSRAYRISEPDYRNLSELAQQKSTSITFIRTNEYGFPYKILGKPKKIVLLGDSFTEGAYVRSNFATLLQAKIAKNYSDDIEVINFGLGSYSPIIELNVLKEYVIPLKPDVVILNFDMTDVHDDYVYSKHLVRQDSGGYTFEVKTPAFLQSTAGSALYFNARLLFGTVDSAYRVARQIKAKASGSGDNSFDEQTIADRIAYRRRIAGQIDLDPIYSYSYKSEDEFLKHLSYTLDNISKISQLSRENKASFILHIYPHSVQIDRGYDCYREAFGLSKNALYSTKIFDETSRFAAENNIKLISSMAVLQRSTIKPYYECDMHLNATGHEIMSEFIYSTLVEDGLLDNLMGAGDAKTSQRTR